MFVFLVDQRVEYKPMTTKFMMIFNRNRVTGKETA